MKIPHCRWLSALGTVVLVGAGVATARADDTAYAIKFVRPYTVGEKYALTTKTQHTQAMHEVVDGKEVLNDAHDFKYELEGTSTITGVDDQGREAKLHVVIKNFKRSEGAAAAADVLPAGTEIDCTYQDGKADFALANGTLTDAAKAALAAVFAPPMHKTDDEMFGTAGKKKVGESWPINAQAMVEDAAQHGMQLDPKKIQGSSKVVSAGAFSGIPGVSLEIKIDITDLSIPPMGKAKESLDTITGSVQMPLDVANPSGATSTTNKLHAVFEGMQKDAKVVLTIDSTEVREQSEIRIK